MRLQAEITRAWVSVLRHLLCRSPAELNDLPLGGRPMSWHVLHGTSGLGDEPPRSTAEVARVGVQIEVAESFDTSAAPPF